MKRTIEVQGKKVEDAIAEGLKIFGARMDEVDIKIISSGGVFKKAKIEMSIGEDEPEQTEQPVKAEQPVKPAKAEQPVKPVKAEQPVKPAKAEQPVKPVKAEQPVKPAKAEQPVKPVKAEQPVKPVKAEQSTKPAKQVPAKGEKRAKKNYDDRPPSAPLKPEYIQRVQGFLSELLAKMGIEGEVEIKEDDGMRIQILTSDSAVIGHRGEVLDALQYLCSLVINEMGGRNVHISLDALGYRAKRVETLKRLAEKTAQRCLKLGRKISLEPMSSAERRIVHATLTDNEGVYTRSEGHEPTRRVVVLPSRKNV